MRKQAVQLTINTFFPYVAVGIMKTIALQLFAMFQQVIFLQLVSHTFQVFLNMFQISNLRTNNIFNKTD